MRVPLLLNVCEELSRLIDEWIERVPKNEYAFVVLDMNQNREIGQNFVRVALSLQKKLKALGKDFIIINASRDWFRFMESQGVRIQTLQDMAEVRASLPPGTATAPVAGLKLDVNFVNPFIEGALHTLKVQCNIETQAGKPYLKGHGPDIEPDIAGVIGLTSKGFVGSIAIVYPAATFLAIMGNMLGEKYDEITKEVEDGAGELLNIIFGQAKTTLNKNGYAVQRAIPTIVRGKELKVRHVTPRPTIVLPFKTAFGPFFVEITIDGDGLWQNG